MEQFLKDNKLRLVKAAETANTTVVNSDVVDTANYEEVAFFCTIAVANAGNYIKVQQDVASDFGTDPADLEGTKVVAAANGDVVAVSVKRPLDRYVRLVVTRGASSAVGDIYAVLSGPRNKPVDNNVDDEIVSESYSSPDEGTA